MYKIAITGNIASGKSQVEKILQELGYPVYDTDKITHEILDKTEEFYGYDVFTNGKIDRRKLGEVVFSNPEIKRKLEDLIHPKVKLRLLELFEHHNKDKFIFISVPLLYEAGFENLFDKVIFIKTDFEIRLKRLMSRNGFTQEEAIRRINAQIPQEEKLQKADFIIENNSTIEKLHLNTEKVINSLT